MKTRCIPAVLAAFLLSGCAELTIDVDVYKGPLTNNERPKVEDKSKDPADGKADAKPAQSGNQGTGKDAGKAEGK